MRRRNYVKTDRGNRAAGKKRLLIAAAAVLGVYLLGSFILGEMGLVKYYRMKAQYSALVEDIVSLKQDNIRLLREVRSLRSDPAYIERIGRDMLGLARPGEIVYYYDDAARK